MEQSFFVLPSFYLARFSQLLKIGLSPPFVLLKNDGPFKFFHRVIPPYLFSDFVINYSFLCRPSFSQSLQLMVGLVQSPRWCHPCLSSSPINSPALCFEFYPFFVCRVWYVCIVGGQIELNAFTNCQMSGNAFATFPPFPPPPPFIQLAFSASQEGVIDNPRTVVSRQGLFCALPCQLLRSVRFSLPSCTECHFPMAWKHSLTALTFRITLSEISANSE